jgi:hypothetical protein
LTADWNLERTSALTLRYSKDLLELIIFSHVIPFLHSACDATMHNDVFAASGLYANWLHQSFARIRAISWMNINVLGPEALRAVICVARSMH